MLRIRYKYKNMFSKGEWIYEIGTYDTVDDLIEIKSWRASNNYEILDIKDLGEERILRHSYETTKYCLRLIHASGMQIDLACDIPIKGRNDFYTLKSWEELEAQVHDTYEVNYVMTLRGNGWKAMEYDTSEHYEDNGCLLEGNVIEVHRLDNTFFFIDMKE